MAEYEPVDLSALYNAGDEAIEGFPKIAGGDRSYLGLPFAVADGPERFVLLEPGAEEVVVPVGRLAERVILAHRRLPPAEGGARPAVGNEVASYGFELDGRDPDVVPIRERFEIGSIEREGWDSDSPFLAPGAGTAEPIGRYEGRWEEVGLRQTEMPFRWRTGEVFLWAWENPDPATPLGSVRLAALGGRVLVVAITLSNAGERPFLRDAAVPVRISLNGAERTTRADRLEVEVDRGVVGYAYPLPAKDLHDFLADPLSGWGQPADPETPHAYVRMAAMPSATVTVKEGEEEIGLVPVGRHDPDGLASGDVGVEVVEHGRNWVHVTVVDDETGRPVPVPRALPLGRGRAVSAARPPRPRELGPGHLAHRRRRRPAARPDHLRLHRRHVPGMAAARRRHRRRRARLRVRAAPQTVADRSRGQRELSCACNAIRR